MTGTAPCVLFLAGERLRWLKKHQAATPIVRGRLRRAPRRVPASNARVRNGPRARHL